MVQTIFPISKLQKEMRVPGDKSISHRAIIFGSIAAGETVITGFLVGADCLATISCFRAMGVPIKMDHNTVHIQGQGLWGLRPSKQILDVCNSGTTLRLLTGVLCAQRFDSQITGDDSIQKRPMARVIVPLSQMGAALSSASNQCAPLKISGKRLHGITYRLPVASAQVKSAILLAALYANGPTVVEEPIPTRDHTERMANAFGATIKVSQQAITCYPVAELKGQTLEVPGDISSAAYFIVAGLICKNSAVTIKNVGLNPTRTGVLDALRQMGADIEITLDQKDAAEPRGTLAARSSALHGITVGGADIPRLIDELPILAVAACFAQGTTIIQDASELAVKESNRIQTISEELAKMGADIVPTPDGLIIHGGNALRGAEVNSHGDHRIAMSLAVAGLCGKGETHIQQSNCVEISYPHFYEDIRKLKEV